MLSENIFTILDEIIDTRFKLSNSGGIIHITENSDIKCKYIKIQTSTKTFSLSLDNNHNVFNCFNSGVKNINKKNDAILFFEKDSYIVVLLIELKSDNPKGYLQQLKAGKNFVEYLLKQIDLFYDINIDKEKIIYRGVLFSTKKSPAKGTTKKDSYSFQDRNGLMCITLNCNQEYKLKKFQDSIKI